jgi:hypothetical protein
VKSPRILAVLGVVPVASGSTATLNLDAADDNVTVSVSQARPAGFEPAAYCSGGNRSIP